MKIALGSDHAGYHLKRHIHDYLRKKEISCDDLGAVNGIDATSYAHFGYAVAKAVAEGHYDFGIVICGTGVGISITANKYPGIRAALCTNEYMARLAREHNDANVLALGGRVIGPALALAIVDVFLSVNFQAGGRHQRRVEEIMAVESGNDLDQHLSCD